LEVLEGGPVAATFSVLPVAEAATLETVELRRRAFSALRSTRDEWVEDGCCTPGGYMPSFKKRALRHHGSSGMV
jgi:hypothetical protein